MPYVSSQNNYKRDVPRRKIWEEMATIEDIHCSQKSKCFTGYGAYSMTKHRLERRRDLFRGHVLEKDWHNIETMVHTAGVTNKNTINDRGDIGVVDTLGQQGNSSRRNCVF